MSDLHLSEGSDGWTLRLSLTPELLALLAEAARTGETIGLASTAVCRMHIEPNLVPGEPFAISEITVSPSVAPSTDSDPRHPHDPTEKRDA